MSLAAPDATKSINQGAIEPWSKPHYRAQLAELKRAAKSGVVRLDVPWESLTDDAAHCPAAHCPAALPAAPRPAALTPAASLHCRGLAAAAAARGARAAGAVLRTPGRRRGGSHRPRRLRLLCGDPGAVLGGHQHVAQLLDLLRQLDQRNDAGALFLAPEEDPLAEDVDRDDLLGADRGSQGLAFLGEALAGGDVEVVLVLEAAEQPAAPAGDLRWVEREVLVLGQRPD